MLIKFVFILVDILYFFKKLEKVVEILFVLSKIDKKRQILNITLENIF